MITLATISLFFISFFPTLGVAGELSSLEALAKKYEGGGVQVGLHAISLDDGREVAAYKENIPLNPASNMKVITAAAAFKNLGVDYRFKTKFLSDGPVAGGRIANLYVVGSGDPSLVEERLWRAAKDIALRGVKEISGDIVIDQSLFGGAHTDAVGEPYRAYNAQISPLAVNYNSFTVIAQPLSGSVHVSIDPPCDYFQLKGHVSLGGKGGPSASRHFDGTREVVTVSGFASGSKPSMIYRNVSSPTLYAGSTLKMVLQQNGVSVLGNIREGVASGSHLLFEDASKPLSLIVYDMNKYSNNFTAEMILNVLGGKIYGLPATPEKGARVLQEYLRELGVDPLDHTIVNGSGLSQKNRVAPRVFTRVLRAVSQNFSMTPEFISSLAISGIDGTVKGRLKNGGLAGLIRVKTGTLNDVSSLTGFIPTKTGKTIAFAVIADGPGAGAGRFHELQEKLALQLINQ